MTRNRKDQPPTPNVPDNILDIPAGLIGTWIGQDGDALLFMTLAHDGCITIAYDSTDDADQTGTFSVHGNEFMADLDDGTTISQMFLLTGDTLIFTGDTEGEIITLHRYHESHEAVPPTETMPFSP